MQNEYENTIRNMIFSNENIKDMLLKGDSLDEYSNKIANLELFFLAFKIFEEEFKNLDIYDYWKELFSKQDYIIDGDRIIFGKNEVSFQLIEVMFLNLMIDYKKKKKDNIIDIKPFIKFDNSESVNNGDNIVKMSIEEDTSDKEAINKLDTYYVDNSKEVRNYLEFISSNFKDMVYDGIVRVYNKLKEDRTNRMFKTKLSLIGNDSKFLDELVIFLLSLYPIHYYAKDKIFIRYDYLKLSDILVDPNHFKFDTAWEMLTNRLEIINTKIELLNNAKSSTHSRKDKIRYSNKLSMLELAKKRVIEQIIDIGEVEEDEVYSGEYIESFYSGELLNKHIIYNLELAINKGYVDIRRNVQGKEELVFYSINGNEVDFIMHIDRDKLYKAIDDISIINLFKSDESYRKVLS